MNELEGQLDAAKRAKYSHYIQFFTAMIASHGRSSYKPGDKLRASGGCYGDGMDRVKKNK